MATTRFNNNLIVAARKMGDKRTAPDSSDDADKRFTSALLTIVQNQAIKDLISDLSKIYKQDLGEVVPEIVKTSAALTVTAGEVVKTDDMWTVLSITGSTGTLIQRLKQDDINPVRNGKHPLIHPSVTRPYFYEEENLIHILPTNFAETVYVRYIEVQENLSVQLGNDGDGNEDFAGNGTYNYLAKTLQIQMNTRMTTALDANKFVMFKGNYPPVGETGDYFFGRVASAVPVEESDEDIITLYGDTLPDTTIYSVSAVMVCGVRNFQNDIKLNEYWDGDIIKRMIELAQTDITKQ